MNHPASNQAARPSGVASAGKLAVLFDGDCALCRDSAEAIRRFDNSGALELLDLHSTAARSRFPSLEFDDLLEELHVVDDVGRIFRGARAINQILRIQHGLRGLLSYLWYVPGFAWMADRQYKRIAKSRYQCAPSSKSCNRASSAHPSR